LTARRYGIATRDITLLPIGGVSNLERMPEDPKQELAVALAGPAVSAAIAVVLYFLLAITGRFVPLEHFLHAGGSFLANLMWVNVLLVVFNLLPAFPMDGGRVLRALLATQLDYARATRIAAGVGQAVAILFGLLGLFVNPWLLLIAIFVYLGAEAESRMVAARSTFRNVPVREAMMTKFRTLSESDTLGHAIEELLAGAQHDFPVVSDGHIVGVLPRATLLQALAQGDQNTRVSDVMDHECAVVDEEAVLDQTFQQMKERGCTSVPVVHGGALVGVLTLENIGEWAMIQSALHRERPPREAEHIAAGGPA
jgi:CBS domain-containing protein